MSTPTPVASRIAAWSDARVATVAGLALFALVAWPVALVDWPPLQDLPNHLATAVALDRPSEYADYVSNGYFKTNSALFVWLVFVGRILGLKAAAKLFVLGTLAASARAIPRLVLRFAGRARLAPAMLLAWPMVHNWFVCMGMLDFALGVGLGWELLLALDSNLARPSPRRALVAALLAIVVWYTHAFAVVIVGLLAFIEAVRRAGWQASSRAALALWLPLVPAAALTAWSALAQLHGGSGAESSAWILRPPWEQVYNAWALWMWGFSRWSATSLVATVALAAFAVRGRKSDIRFFSWPAIIVLSALYFFGPYHAANWFCVNARLLPALWMAALLRVPPALPRWLTRALVASAALYALGLGFDYVRLGRDWRRFTAAAAAIPEHAKVLPLVFDRKGSGENTWPMLHAWGLVVVEKHTTAPLLFAHSRSFPVSYRQQPSEQLNQLHLEVFPEGMRDPAALCGELKLRGIVARDCDGLYAQLWRDFWLEAAPLGDYLLVYGASAEAIAQLPRDYAETWREGTLVIYARSVSAK